MLLRLALIVSFGGVTEEMPQVEVLDLGGE